MLKHDLRSAGRAGSVRFAESILGPERAQQMLVEEVERPDDRGSWVITLSLPSNGLAAFTGGKEYKTFVVDAETGEVKSMKIRQLAA